ncbi:MAG: GNAT family N-acetyltransferase [Bdellovibrionales bacterium]
MTELSAVYPTLEMAAIYQQFLQEYLEDDQEYYSLLRDLYEEVDGDVDLLIGIVSGRAKGQYLPQGWCSVTTLWLKVKDKIVGEAVIRHELNNDILRNFAGHVTYYILPSCRGKRYGGYLLQSVIKEAKRIGIPELVFCCDEANMASRKLLESLGAKPADVIDNRDDWGEMTCRYFVTV